VITDPNEFIPKIDEMQVAFVLKAFDKSSYYKNRPLDHYFRIIVV